uniref:Uncharacterized protein n=1 Tax=Glossina austeni TaxID=7395 RepID=A0A1A9URW3_GLOAU
MGVIPVPPAIIFTRLAVTVLGGSLRSFLIEKLPFPIYCRRPEGPRNEILSPIFICSKYCDIFPPAGNLGCVSLKFIKLFVIVIELLQDQSVEKHGERTTSVCQSRKLLADITLLKISF